MGTAVLMSRRLLLPFLALPIAGGLLACTEGTSPGSLGQLRVHPVFAQGEEPATLGISPSEIRIVLRRFDGAVVADTTLPYVTGDTTSWLIDLESPPEQVNIDADLGQGAATMYTGTGQVSLGAGIGPSSTRHDLPVHYLRGPDAPFSIDISPDSAGLQLPGDTRQFTAVARDNDGAALTGFTFTWASANSNVASINATTGLVTAVAPGRSEITATSGGVVGTAVITVGPSSLPMSIHVSPDSGALSLGGVLQFKAVAKDAQGNIVPGVVPKWSSTDIDVATVSDSGLATAVSAGQTKIIARFGTLADSAKLVVFDQGTGNPGIVSIVVTPPAASINVGATQQFTATALDAQGDVIPGVIFAWASSSGNVASVNGAGLATALASGGTTITATAFGGTGSAFLTVSTPPGPAVLIVVLPGAATITALGATQQFTAVAFDAQGRIVQSSFTWSTSNPAIATINAAGVATGITTGSVTVTATTPAGRTGTATLNVTQTVQSITVTPATATVVAGDTTRYTAVAHDANGNVIPNTVFNWVTANPSIATVSATGLVTGVSGGGTVVQAIAGGVGGSATVSVVVVGSVEILGAAERFIRVGETLQFVAVVRDAAGNIMTGVTVSWSVLKPNIASVNSSGLATGLSVGITYVRAAVGNVWDEAELGIRP
jgi:uncharacterized protein YjdB